MQNQVRPSCERDIFTCQCDYCQQDLEEYREASVKLHRVVEFVRECGYSVDLFSVDCVSLTGLLKPWDRETVESLGAKVFREQYPESAPYHLIYVAG